MDGWSIRFDIPQDRWIALGAAESEETRAHQRAWLRRRLGAVRFNEEKHRNTVWRVNRFVLLVGVCSPVDGVNLVPSYACEVVKPLVDAGTDAKLWFDDDALHRTNTTYFAMRDQWHDGRYHVLFIVLPITADFEANRALAAYYRTRHIAAHTLHFNIPHRLWLTSNFNDSDLLARQKGSHVYGSKRRFIGNVSPENRKALRGNLMAFVTQRWKDYTRLHIDTDYVTVAGVSYPSHNDSDPDNATETIACILGAGLVLGKLPSITGTCGEVSIYKCSERSMPSYHGVTLELYERDRNLADLISALVRSKTGK